MPNNSYLRSRLREQKLVRELRKKGWIAARSAGSKSPIDVWAYHPELKQLRMFQIKTTKGGRGLEEVTKWMHSDVVARFVWQEYK